jgi:hypothetical protein
MSAMTRARFRAATVAIAPVVLLVGFVSHPYHPGPPDVAAIATAAASNTTRWGLAHLTIAVASGLLVLAFLAIRISLREVGEERWSALAVPFIVMGGTLYALPPGMEFAPLGAAEAGVDGQAVQSALIPWVGPVLLTGGLIFALGVFGFAKGIAHSGILSPRVTRLVVGALAGLALARLIPLTEVQFYVQSAAGIMALWPLAYEMWRHPAAQTAGEPRAMPAP